MPPAALPTVTPAAASVFDMTTFHKSGEWRLGSTPPDVRLLVVTGGVEGELEDLGGNLTRACPPSRRRARHGTAPARNI